VGEHQPFFQQSSLFSLYRLTSPSTISHDVRFFGIAQWYRPLLFGGGPASRPFSDAHPSVPAIYQVLVGNLQGNTTYSPPYIVSQVPAAQPNPHTNTLPFRRAQRMGMR
jgi:hypothetical protein